MVTETKNGYIRDVNLNKKTTLIVTISIVITSLLVFFLNKEAQKII